MIQVLSGSTTWEQCPTGTPKPGYVLFDPLNLIYNADGFTLDMVWDSGLNTIRVRTQPERDAATAQAVTNLRTDATTAMEMNHDPLWKAIRAAAAVLVDEINLLRQRDRDRSTDVAAATSLADLK